MCRRSTVSERARGPPSIRLTSHPLFLFPSSNAHALHGTPARSETQPGHSQPDEPLTLSSVRTRRAPECDQPRRLGLSFNRAKYPAHDASLINPRH
ncbi:hypothetical protein CABS01_01683 [Colletotrichum abscissum]|uniref:uncharacterized protein n=1 Tax=Colletotrichum abscissum TaxID=1671311 RepID=UPI0027D5676A|nr:uncharacterized protein CABS01_01683 [Colletotrichum abscissum]KAI3546014.1 hypothetical protein CSPX01_04510 [Colletotrichum filicis]KAK1495876.1 hypothetical protein CABS01_01683 [Colletotrichum abscissum]